MALQAVIRLILIAAGKSHENILQDEIGTSEIVDTMRRRLSYQDDSLSAIFDLTTDGVVDLDLIFSSTIFDEPPEPLEISQQRTMDHRSEADHT